MLRVLTLSTLFPTAAEPLLGLFVERQTLKLAARGDVELEIVAPVGLPPFPLSRHPHYAPRRRERIREEWKGLALHRPRFRAIPHLGERHAAAAMAKALVPYLREVRARFVFDVIDAEFFWPDGPAAMRIADALGVPFSVKGRGADIHYWGRREGIGEQLVAAARAAGGLLAVSEALKADMAALGMPEDKIKVHRTGVDLERFSPLDRTAAREALGVEGPLLVSVGALIPRKAQALAIAAAAKVPGATLFLIGEGPDRAKLERMARKREIPVRFLGARPPEALPPLIGAADVMLLPSRSEGLANVMVEALACGTPVVATAGGGAREAIDRPEAGRLVPADAGAETIAAAARELLADPPAQRKVREAAKKFSWEANAKTLRAHLAAVARS